jgi:hypothetical protein
MTGGWRISWRRRRVISRRVVGRSREIGLSIIAIVIGRRSRERSERRGYDRRGGADDSARRTERPEQWKRRTRRIILSLGGRNRHSGEPGSKRSRDCHLADGHGGLPDRTPRASVSGGEARKTYSVSRAWASTGGLDVTRALIDSYQKFESISLQRRVSCKPHFRGASVYDRRNSLMIGRPQALSPAAGHADCEVGVEAWRKNGLAFRRNMPASPRRLGSMLQEPASIAKLLLGTLEGSGFEPSVPRQESGRCQVPAIRPGSVEH